MFTKPAILTHKQRSFYDALSDYIQNFGQAPTIKEMMRMCRASSPRSVQQYLDVLVKKGLITRSRYSQRGIFLTETVPGHQGTVFLPVVASAGCDHGSIFAEKNFSEFVCVAAEALAGRKTDNVVCIRAVGNSMDDAGVSDGDNVLVEMTDAVTEGDLVVAILDGFAVIKKLELANNAIILRPVSSDPQYKPIILRRDFKIFGRVVDVIRTPQKGDIEVIPLIDNE